MDSNLSTVPIRAQELAAFFDRANRLLVSVKWTPKPALQMPASSGGTPAWRESTSSSPVEEELSLMQIARSLCNDPLLFPAAMNHALTSLRQALAIGMHLSKSYTKFSGLDQLVSLNAKGGLADLQKVEFRNKYQTASAIAVFAAAYSLAWELTQYHRDETADIRIEVPTPPEVFLQDPVRSLECFVYYLAAFVHRSGGVRSDLEFLKAAMLYAERTVEEIALRQDSFAHVEPFTAQVYQLENSDFRIEGFKAELGGSYSSVEFNRIELHDIVGNRDAKHQARRLVSRLLCYDPVEKRNPMYDLGGLAPVSMGFGDPGTGKSLLISAVATMLDDGCRNLGLPFLFWPMPDTVVSTFQGGSAERMMTWMAALKDPAKIIYAPIDDAENNLEDRSRQGVSAGVREVIAVFLRNTEGAYAVHRGNTLIQLFTNLPDQIDRAVLSRIQTRAAISGATTHHDFLDQDHLWYRKYRELSSDFVNLKDPVDYTFLADQADLQSLSETAEELWVPREARIRRIFEGVRRRFTNDGHDFFAALFTAVKQELPSFTSRDVRNIQRAVDARVLDFDFPDAWMERPELFFRSDYATKRAMLVEQMKLNMGRLSFRDIRLQETVRYLDTMIAVADSGRERRINGLIQDFELEHEARGRFAAHGGRQCE